MRELLEESKTNREIRRSIESLFALFNVKISKNETVNYGILLWISSLYYTTIDKIEDPYAEYDENISALYKYNKIKDTAQGILGKLAEIKHLTNKKIAEEYGTPE